MGPIQEANRGNQEQQPTSGGITRGINTLNNLARFKNNSLGGMGGKVVVQAGKKIATSFITTIGPWIWAVVASIVVSIITFLITFFGGPAG